MTDVMETKRTRRAVLVRAAAATAGGAALALGLPATASGDNGQSMVLGQGNTATATTSLTTTGAHGFASSTNGGDAFRGVSSAANASGVFGTGTTATSYGVFGYNGTNMGRAALGAPTAALWVSQYSAPWAVQVTGKVSLSRSGRVTVAAGKSSIDVDLRAKGGLGGTPLLFATMQTLRSGVYVAAVRPNYPSAGKFRIHLNKAVASATNIAWLVLG